MDNENQRNVISRAALLAGKNTKKEIFIKELDAYLTIQPLTNGQWAQVEATGSRGTSLGGRPVMDSKGNPDFAKTSFELRIDMEKTTNAEFESDCLAVFYGVVGDENWTVDDVKSIRPAGLVKQIAEEIYKISGVGKRGIEQIKNFRGDS